MRISDWSSDVCSSDLTGNGGHAARPDNVGRQAISLCSNCDDDIRRGRGSGFPGVLGFDVMEQLIGRPQHSDALVAQQPIVPIYGGTRGSELQQRQPKRAFHGWNEQRCRLVRRSEEHTSELQSLMRISYAVFCLKKKKEKPNT